MALILNRFLAPGQGMDEEARGCRGERDGLVVMSSRHPTYEENNAEVLRLLLGAARVPPVVAVPMPRRLTVEDVAAVLLKLIDLTASHRHGGNPCRPTERAEIRALATDLKGLIGGVEPDARRSREPNPYEAGDPGRNPYEPGSEG